MLPWKALDSAATTVQSIDLGVDAALVAIRLPSRAGARATIADGHVPAALAFDASLAWLTDDATPSAVLRVGADVNATRAACRPPFWARFHTSSSLALCSIWAGNSTRSAVVVVRVEVSTVLGSEGRRTKCAATCSTACACVAELSGRAPDRTPSAIERIAHTEEAHSTALGLPVGAEADACPFVAKLALSASVATCTTMKRIGEGCDASAATVHVTANTTH